jgi:hypothetical protein
MSNKIKVVVFDLDETLGYFKQFGLLWESIITYLKQNNTFFENTEQEQNAFNETLDMYPEFIRPNIEMILNYLKDKKDKNECDSVMIYTNNRGPKKWVYLIKNYFETKLNDFLFFNQIISAFKVNGKQIEPNRTTHEKTYNDLIECSKIPKNSQICFLDDTHYPQMTNDNVYYIKLKPYVYNIPIQDLINRFTTTMFYENISNRSKSDVIECITQHINSCDYTYVKKSKKEYVVDVVITKKILEHIHDFFQDK